MCSYLAETTVPTKFGVPFGKLYSFPLTRSNKAFHRKTLSRIAIESITSLAGGDVNSMLTFLFLHNAGFHECVSSLVLKEEENRKKEFSSLVCSITTALNFLTPFSSPLLLESSPPSPLSLSQSSPLPLSQSSAVSRSRSSPLSLSQSSAVSRSQSPAVSFDSNSGESEQKSNVLRGMPKIHIAQASLLRSILADSSLSYKFIVKMGGNLNQGNFSALRSKCEVNGLVAVLEARENKVGQKSAMESHPKIMKDFVEKMETSENSAPSNTRKLKKQKKSVRELVRPFSQAIAESGFQIAVQHGGRMSDPKGVSASTLYKYRPKYIVPPIANSMQCSDCAQRYRDIHFFNRVFDDVKTFIEENSIGQLEHCIGKRAEVLERAERIGLSQDEIAEVGRRYTSLQGTQIHYSMFRYQIALRRAMRSTLPFGQCLVAADFGQSFWSEKAKMRRRPLGEIYHKLLCLRLPLSTCHALALHKKFCIMLYCRMI